MTIKTALINVNKCKYMFYDSVIYYLICSYVTDAVIHLRYNLYKRIENLFVLIDINICNKIQI